MKQTILSSKQGEILEDLIVSHGQIVTSQQIYQAAGRFFDYQQTKNLVLKLVKNGWLIRIKRGVYALSNLSSRGYLNLSPLIVANLIENNSYVSFESALQQHGMFDQLTNRTVSVSLKAHKAVELSGTEYVFIKTRLESYYGWQEVQIGDLMARIATPEKALIDMVAFHKSQYSIDLVIEKLLEHRDDLDLTRLSDYLAKCSTTTIKIFGLLFDLIGLDSGRIYGLVDNKTGTHWMLPGDRTFYAKWRLYYNEYFERYKKI